MRLSRRRSPDSLAYHNSERHSGLAGIKEHAIFGERSGPQRRPLCALPTGADHSLQQAADIINKGTKVAMLLGRGCLNSESAIRQGGYSGPQSVHHGRHRITGNGAIAGRASGMRYVHHGGDQLSLYGVLPKPGKAKSIQIDIDPARMGCGIRLRWVSPAIAAASCAHSSPWPTAFPIASERRFLVQVQTSG
jgi:hypothetical protein